MENFLKKFEDGNKEKRQRIVEKIRDDINIALTFCLTFCNFTTILPIFSQWPQEFRMMVERALFDNDMKIDLEDAKVINWCRTSQTLYPLNTPKDGNCLLHAISLSIWGLLDNEMILRRLLHASLLHDVNEKFKKRYMFYVKDRSNEMLKDLIQFNTMDITNDWTSIVENVKPKVNPSFANPHVFLEAIHIFVMANILKRPIIVMADNKIRTLGEAVSLQENDISGIYLPLEVPPGNCNKSPIIIGFSCNHFCPLVMCKINHPSSTQKLAVPLQKNDMTQLPLKFLYSKEEKQVLNLSSSYLNQIDLVHSGSGSFVPISGAKIGQEVLPENLNLLPDYFQDCERKYRRLLNAETSNEKTPAVIPAQQRYYGLSGNNPSPETMHYFQNRKCSTPSCQMYGTAATGNMCSECLKKYTEENTGQPVIIDINMEATAPPPSFPLQESFIPETLMPQLCQEPGCNYHCSNQTIPYCHECYGKKQAPAYNISSHSSETEEKQRLSAELETRVQLPGVYTTSSNNLSETQLYGSGTQLYGSRGNRENDASVTLLKCNTSGCQEKGMRDHAGLCIKCYIKTGIPDPSSAPPAHNFEIQSPFIQLERSNQIMNTGESSITRSSQQATKYICSTAGCPGIRQENKHGMCFICLEKNTSKSRQAPALPEMGVNHSMEENLMESRTPSNAVIESRHLSYMDDNSTECASPMCNKRVYPPTKLCQSCLDVLRQNQVCESSSGLCRAQNCTFYGSLELNGYCSGCFKYQQVGNHSAPVAGRNMYPVESPLVVRSNTAPITRKGNPCVVQGCTRYGDPSTKNMCSRCYSINTRSLSANQHERIPVQEASLPFVGSGQFMQSAQRLEESQKQSTICRKAKCQNFGNSSTEGFCNACYKRYYQHEFNSVDRDC